MKWTNPLWKLIDLQHICTPIAVERIYLKDEVGSLKIRLVYVFGVKVAYFNVTPF